MLGLAAADTGAHERALVHLQRSVELAERAGSHQQAAFSLSFVGRSHFLREEVDEARAALERSLAIARETRWVAFEPWPESWLAEADLAAGLLPAGRERFEHAWALASELGDPCWEGAAGQGLGRVACKEGRVATGLRLLEEARRRAASFPDAYVWVEAYALAELALAAVEAGHRRARQWVEDLSSLTARTGMRELAVRAYLLRADLGDGSALESAQILAAEVENPALQRRIADLLDASQLPSMP
jgi:tetratricopeptide (TPR) repeat protein